MDECSLDAVIQYCNTGLITHSKTDIGPGKISIPSDITNHTAASSNSSKNSKKKREITKTFLTRARTAKNKALLANNEGFIEGNSVADQESSKIAMQTNNTSSKIVHKKTVGASIAKQIGTRKVENLKKSLQEAAKKNHNTQIKKRPKKVQIIASLDSAVPAKTTKVVNSTASRKRKQIETDKKPKKCKISEVKTIKPNISTDSKDIIKKISKNLAKKTIPNITKNALPNNELELDLSSVIEAINVRIKKNKQSKKGETKKQNGPKNNDVKISNKSSIQSKSKVEKSKIKALAKCVAKPNKLSNLEKTVSEVKRKYTKKDKHGNNNIIKKSQTVKKHTQNANKSGKSKSSGTGDSRSTSTSKNKGAQKSPAENKHKKEKNTRKLQKSGTNHDTLQPKRMSKSCSENNYSDYDSDQSSTLYSLLTQDLEPTSTKIPNHTNACKNQNKKRKTDSNSPKVSKKASPKKDSPKKDESSLSRRNSPKSSTEKTPRKMLLKDSVKPKEHSQTGFCRLAVEQSLPPDTGPNGPKTAASASSIGNEAATPLKISPVAPSQSMSPCAFYQSESSPVKKLKPNMGSRMPIIPLMPAYSSPSNTYEKLVKNLPNRLQSNRHVKRKGSNSDEEGDIIERRLSVRQSESAYKYKEIIVKKCQGYTQLWFNSNTKVKNALNPKVMQELNQALHNAKFDDTKLILLSGHGSMFCSGVDLNFLLEDRKTGARAMASSLREFVNTLIAFPKPVIAAVNGPTVGLGVAILPLCDIVYASDKATFCMPYTKLAQTPEGCSSYTFPHVMGMAMANEMLLGARKLTAIEACQVGLVSQVFWPTSMMQEVIPRVQNIAINSATALEASKILMRSHQRAKLEYTNESECHMLQERWAATDCQRAIKAYMDKVFDL